jgi:hypothetical protein
MMLEAPAIVSITTQPDAASLDRLHDIITLPPVSWWPLAQGSLILAALVLFLLLLATVRLTFRRRFNLYRRQALAELKQLPCRADAMNSLAILLKRVAISAFPRDQVASLTGMNWIEFLHHTGGNFSDRAGHLLAIAPYDLNEVQQASNKELHDVMSAARFWIAHHRATAAEKETARC